MVLRIFRRGICRPSKFRRPKYNALLDRLKGTSCDEQRDEVARCKRCQGVTGSFGTQFNDPSNFKRPTLHIAHSTVFSTGKGDDKDPLTLLESIKQRLASHNIPLDTSVDEPAKLSEATEDILDETEEKGEHQFSKDTAQVEETVRATPISDADNAKDHELLNEPGDDRRSVFHQPHIKSYARYHQQTEKHNEAQMFDELAKKYLVSEKDQIDKRLSQDMERLGLPVNTSEAMRPPVNVYVSGEEESREEYAPRPSESSKTEAPVAPSYYENANWCSNYFKDTPNETLLAIARANKEIAEEVADKHKRDALHNDMLPLNWCYDSYFDFKKSEQDSNISKLQFDKHDDMLPFHEFQCQEFINLDLSVKTDPVESPVQNLNLEENLPIHFSQQGALSDNIPTSPVEAAEPSEPIIRMFNTSMIQDSDVTKFEYVYSRDYCDLQSTLYDRNEPLSEQQTEFKAKTQATHPIESSDTILQIQSQTMPRTQIEQSSQQAVGAKVYEQVAYQKTNKTKNILQMNSERRETEEGQTPDQTIPVEKIIHAKVLEQVQGAGASQNMEPRERSIGIPHIQSQDVTYLTQKTVKPEPFAESKMVGNTAEKIDMSGKTKDSSLINKDSRAVFDKAPAEPIETTQTMKNSTQTNRESQAIVQSLNQPQAEHTDASRATAESLHSSQKIVQSYIQAHEKVIDTSQTIKDSPYTKESQAIVENSNQAQEVAKTLKAQNTEQQEHMAQTIPTGPKVVQKTDIAAEKIQPTRGSEAMAQSCVQAQTVGKTEATKTAQPSPLNNVPKLIDDALKKLNLDTNLSLSELLRRVRTRNRLQYYNDIRTQMIKSMSSLQSKCPPSDRPESPCPPDCYKPCPPRPKKRKKSKKRKTKKCPKPKKPKCPAKPHKCPKPKKCPPPPPKCPPKPKKSPCPCPPPPQCPPQPPKCPCQVTDLNDSVIPPLCFLDFFESTSSRLKHFIGILKQGFLESRDRFVPTCSADPSLETDVNQMKLNRVKDFEPWTPIPSWPFPVHHKKRSLQCPYHGCPHPKPGPVRPNCPELPCAGFPKRLTFSELHHEAPHLTRGFCKSEWMKPKFVDKPYSERQELPLSLQTTRGHDKVRYGELGRHVWKSHNNDLCKILAKNGNVQRIFASLALYDPGKTKGTKTESTETKYSLIDGKSKRHEVEAIIQTYSELKACTTSHVKKSGNLAEVESAIESATLKATTANVDDAEKLKQKLETIEEVPLVEADPDILKPPRASGPNVMNITELKNYEEVAQNSDFQIGEDRTEPEFVYGQAETKASPNYIKHYFESSKEEDPSQKPNLNDMVTLNAVPEINAEEELSLKELMERVRQRNRLLRCRDIDQNLNTASTTMDNKNRPQQPQYNPPTIQPGWGWPNPQHPGYGRPTTYPYVSNPSPQKSEPLTPDNRPGHYRATKVNPVNLALHLGPLVDAFKNAGILFPLLLVAYLFPKTGFSAGSDERRKNNILQAHD